MQHGLAILKRLLQRQHSTHGRLDSLLVLVRHDPLIAAATGTLAAAEQDWSVHQAQGPLSLRAALLEPGPHVIVLGDALAKVPLDLAEQAWLRKALLIEARDVIAALTGRNCAPLDDAVLERLRDRLDVVERRARTWPWRGNQAVQRAEVDALLADADPITHRLSDELLADWLLDDSADHTDQIHALERFGPDARWLKRAATPEGLGEIVTAGALAPVPRLAHLVDPALVDLSGDLGRLVSGALKRINAGRGHPLLKRARQLMSAVTLKDYEKAALRLFYEDSPDDDDDDAPLTLTAPQAAPVADWLKAITPPEVRRVFAYLAEHRTISEPELLQLLGNARRVRKFARTWGQYGAPFTLILTNDNGVKRYTCEEKTA